MNIARSRFQADPDGLLAAALLSLLATAGFYYINIMPALVEGLKVGLHYDDQTAGLVVSANVYGAAAGAFAAAFLVARWPWRRACAALLAVLIVCDLACLPVVDYTLLMGLRALHGLAGGCLVGISYGVFARTHRPERTFGMLLLLQGGLGGLGVMALPRLVPLFGTRILFLVLACVSLAALAALPLLAPYPRRNAALAALPVRPGARSPDERAPLATLSSALLSIFLFQFANMLLFTYIIGLARHFGLEPLRSAAVVGVSTWVGMLGSALVIFAGTRFGRVRILTISLLLTAAGMWALHGSASATIYALANVGTAITWSFVVPHLLGICARCDLSGMSAALGGFASKLGLATGPLTGALLLHAGRYDLLINVATVGIIACAAVVLLPASRLDRADAHLAAASFAATGAGRGTDIEAAGAQGGGQRRK